MADYRCVNGRLTPCPMTCVMIVRIEQRILDTLFRGMKQIASGVKAKVLCGGRKPLSGIKFA